MRQQIKFTYIEKYLPTPRSKKMREREAQGSVRVNICEMPCWHALPVMIIKNHDNDQMNIRCFRGKLYRNLQGINFKLNKDVNIAVANMDWQRLLWGKEQMARVENRPNTKEGAINYIRKNAKRFIVIDGYVYERAMEPIYKIYHFGVCTHAAMAIDWDCKENRRSFTAYSALEREKCQKTLAEILSHCTEKYDNSQSVMIEVIDKNFVRFKRNKDYLEEESFISRN